jgi:hypothetical protein
MEDSLSITKDIGEYYIYLKDNSNLIAKGYEKSLVKKVAIETTKVFEWVIFTNEKYLQNMVKVDLEVQFKISVMKRKFENQKHKA